MAVAQARRRVVEVLYQAGTPVDDIVESLKPDFESANRRNIEADIHIIRTRWKDQVRDVFGSDVRSWFVYTALGDRRRAIEAGNLQLAYSISRDLAKLAGVNLSDLTVEHSTRVEGGQKVATFMELMQEERRRKQLPPADFEVLKSEPLPAGDDG
jgi:hypothetical protein